MTATQTREVARVEAQPVRASLIADMAMRYNMEPKAFVDTLRATVVPPKATNEEFAAFLMVAKEYSLNPITKEIYAFPKQGGGIQPIVSVDGWANLINSHPQCDGFEFEDKFSSDGNLVSITCRIYRKDRSRPTTATEYMAECKRPTSTWGQWPRRMLRHKALIQAARYAFGFAGIVDPDEAERFTTAPRASIASYGDDGPPIRGTITHTSQDGATNAEYTENNGTAHDSDGVVLESVLPTSRTQSAPESDAGSAAMDEEREPVAYVVDSTGMSVGQYADAYIKAIQTSQNTKDIYDFMDLNKRGLDRLYAKHKPSADRVRKAADEMLAKLRPKNTEQTRAVTSEPARDSGPPRRGKTTSQASSSPDPEDKLKAIKVILDEITDADKLKDAWLERCIPIYEELAFPPDQDAANKMYSDAERRLGIE